MQGTLVKLPMLRLNYVNTPSGLVNAMKYKNRYQDILLVRTETMKHIRAIRHDECNIKQ